MEANGTTFYDRTNYFETLPGVRREPRLFALKLEAERMTQAFMKKESLDTEMTVVRNEFESGENNPLRVLWQKMQASAYDWHNYGKSTIGARSDIENVDIERLRAFYRTYYQPDNAVLVVAGKFDPAKTLAQDRQRLRQRSRSPRARCRALYTPEPTRTASTSSPCAASAARSTSARCFRVMQGAHPDYAAMRRSARS